MAKFNVGDVVVTLEKCGWAKIGQGLVFAGAIGKVKAVDGDLLTVKFNKKQPLDSPKTNEYRKNFVVRTSEVRLATAEEAATIAKKKKQAEVITSDETITFEGEQYRKVDRKAQAGDVVVSNAKSTCFVASGIPYKVSNSDLGPVLNGGTNDIVSLYNGGRTPETVDVYEKVEAEYVPQKGDIVVITANTNASRNAVGDVGKVGKVSLTGLKGAWVDVPGKTSGNGNYTKLEEMRKATPAEVEAYEKAVADASKPKLKAGDFVKITKGTRTIIQGEVYEVFDDENGIHILDVDGDSRYFPLSLGRVRYEILSAEEVAKHAETDKWAKLGRKPGEFKKGDIVYATGKMMANRSELLNIAGQVEDVTSSAIGIRFFDRQYCGTYIKDGVVLVAPVDARFDK